MLGFQFIERCLDGLQASAAEENGASGVEQAFGNGAADAASAAGNDSAFVGEKLCHNKKFTTEWLGGGSVGLSLSSRATNATTSPVHLPDLVSLPPFGAFGPTERKGGTTMGEDGSLKLVAKMLSGAESVKLKQNKEAPKDQSLGERYRNAGKYDPVLRAHCRLDGEGSLHRRVFRQPLGDP